MFTHVNLAPGEKEQMAARGVPASALAESRMDLTCTKLKHGCCTVYAVRPIACRKYRCVLLRQAESGTLPIEEAQQIVRKAVSQADALRAALPPGTTLADVRRQWISDKGHSAPALDPAQARAQLQAFAFYRFMDRHFRKPEQFLVTPAEGESM